MAPTSERDPGGKALHTSPLPRIAERGRSCQREQLSAIRAFLRGEAAVPSVVAPPPSRDSFKRELSPCTTTRGDTFNTSRHEMHLICADDQLISCRNFSSASRTKQADETPTETIYSEKAKRRYSQDLWNESVAPQMLNLPTKKTKSKESVLSSSSKNTGDTHILAHAAALSFLSTARGRIPRIRQRTW